MFDGKIMIPGVTRSAIPRSRALVATSTIRRKSLRHHRNRCVFPSSSSTSSFLLACSKKPRQSRSFRYTALIPFDSGMRLFRISFFSTASFSWRLYGRQPVQVGWPEARIASWSVLLRNKIIPCIICKQFYLTAYVILSITTQNNSSYLCQCMRLLFFCHVTYKQNLILI